MRLVETHFIVYANSDSTNLDDIIHPKDASFRSFSVSLSLVVFHYVLVNALGIIHALQAMVTNMNGKDTICGVWT